MLSRLTTSTLLASLTFLCACSSDDPRGPTTGAPSPTTPEGSSSKPNGTTTPGQEPADNTDQEKQDSETPATPAVQFIGRFDATRTKTAWPGGRIVARFTGTTAKATLSQVNGLSGGNSWLNVLVDGQVTKKVEVLGTSQKVTLAENLTPGIHVVELEKRTEPNVGTLVFEGFDFGDGELLAPPPRKSRRIEFLSDSTIDGFGVDGVFGVTCNDGAPVALANVRKSAAFVTASLLDAESHVIASSGRGIVRNETGAIGDTFPEVYVRTLPDIAGDTWDFSSWTPDAVVISLGGTDIGPGNLPNGFQSDYDALITSIRGRHPNAHIYMTIWSQIKDLGEGANYRTMLRTALDGIKTAHPNDPKLHVFAWNEADHARDETGCAFHANEGHGIATAHELAPVIASDLGW